MLTVKFIWGSFSRYVKDEDPNFELWLAGKGKVNVLLCSIKHHAMNAYRVEV